MSTFRRAVKHESKLRLPITGPSGSGKTLTALLVASNLGGPFAVIDTEHGAASKYADRFTFDTMYMEPPFHPDRLLKAIKEAEAGGYTTLVIDSASHFWSGAGGVLEIVEKAAIRSNSKDTFRAWGTDGTPVQRQLVDGILRSNLHIIATIRAKTDYVIEKNKDGKTEIRKVGLAPVQRDDLEYEFDVALRMDIEHNAVVSKTRFASLDNAVFNKPGKDLADLLVNELRGAPADAEVMDVLSERSVQHAASSWNISVEEARKQIERAIENQALAQEMAKSEFKDFVSGVSLSGDTGTR